MGEGIFLLVLFLRAPAGKCEVLPCEEGGSYGKKIIYATMAYMV